MAIKIISLSGYIGSGKNQFANTLNGILFDRHTFPVLYQQKAHATKLKQIASILLNVPIHNFEDQEFKKTDLGPEWDRSTKDAKEWLITKYGIPAYFTADEYREKALKNGFKFTRTVREFMQELGTDALRYNLHENIWVNALWCDYITAPSKNTHAFGERILMDFQAEPVYPNWIITDTRFGNEMDEIRRRNGVAVRINRGPRTSDHASEVTIDTIKDWDYQIDNTGSLEQLHEKAKEFINHFNL